MKAIKIVLLLSLSSTLFSCSDDDCNQNQEKDQSIPIQRIEVDTEIDLSKYENWYCVVGGENSSGGYMYNHELINNKLVITPQSADKTYYTTNNLKNVDGNSIPSLTLYWIPKEKQYRGRDQSSFEKMFQQDALSWKNLDTSSSFIPDAKLEHERSMARFTTENLPENAKVRIITKRGNGPIILPYVKDGAYHFIDLFAILARVYVLIGDKEYEVDILEDKNVHSGGSNSFYTFVLRYDANAEDGKILTVNDLKSENWVNQHFEL